MLPQKIEQFKPGSSFRAYLKVFDLQKREKRNGDSYLSLNLGDGNSKVGAKVWDRVDTFISILKVGGIYLFKGDVGVYNGKLDLKINDVEQAKEGIDGFDKEAFVEKPKFDLEKIFIEVENLIKTRVNNIHLKKISFKYLKEKGELFKRHYGAIKVHHAYVGGLMEHTLSMMKLASFLAVHYKLDESLLITGTLLHDCGKLQEIISVPAPGITLEGGLLGHIVSGTIYVKQLISEIDGFPKDLELRLLHLIVSHHGSKEFGSPEVPKTKEAIVLNLIDMIDSKLRIFTEAIEKSSGNDQLFSDYIPFLQRKILLK